ncbi:MAG: DUF1295 domain-containing protein, partial [Thermoleophilaceae bacterium]|nr:DUF1295 domain-containing protein [Thermoleophilaceae bacterium]
AAGGQPEASLPIAAVVTFWAARLATHIALRHTGEDRRYVEMRERQGASFPLRSLISVFLVQAGVAWLVSLPILALASTAPEPRLLLIAGLLIALAGLVTEMVADLQLTRFRMEDHGRDAVLDTGLWHYSRHPNYFGDALFWWGIWIAVVIAAPGLWWTVAGPALMTFFLLRVSGVVLLERSIGERRPAYRAYVERTSAFVPWPPRKR